MTSIYKPHSVRANWVGGSETICGGVTRFSLPLNPRIETQIVGDSIYPVQVAYRGASPMGQITATQLKQWLDLCNIIPQCITFDGTHEGLELYTAQRDCAGIAAGSVHANYTIAQGILAPSRIRADHQRTAEIEYRVEITDDGTNDPIVRNTSVALPAVTDSIDTWEMGPVSIGGNPMTCKKSVEVIFTTQVMRESCDNEVFDSFAGIQGLIPVINLRGIEASWFPQFAPLAGSSVIHANTKVYFRKHDIADATPQHILLTMAGKIYPQMIFDGDLGALRGSETSAAITCVYDGTNAPIVFDTAAQIT